MDNFGGFPPIWGVFPTHLASHLTIGCEGELFLDRIPRAPKHRGTGTGSGGVLGWRTSGRKQTPYSKSYSRHFGPNR